MSEANTANPRLPTVLLIEDNTSDIELTRQGLIEGRIRHKLVVARDGRQALHYLQQRYTDERPPPDLILLDLDLPGYSGREVLAYLRKHAQLREIPVVIFTSSDLDRDLLSVHELPEGSYIRKPVDFEAFVETVIELANRWLKNGRHPA